MHVRARPLAAAQEYRKHAFRLVLRTADARRALLEHLVQSCHRQCQSLTLLQSGISLPALKAAELVQFYECASNCLRNRDRRSHRASPTQIQRNEIDRALSSQIVIGQSPRARGRRAQVTLPAWTNHPRTSRYRAVAGLSLATRRVDFARDASLQRRHTNLCECRACRGHPAESLARLTSNFAAHIVPPGSPYA